MLVFTEVLDFNPAESVVVALESTVRFECVIQGTFPSWIINENYLDIMEMDTFEDEGYHFNSTKMADVCQYHLVLELPARVENNLTSISCSAGPGQRTGNSIVIIAGQCGGDCVIDVCSGIMCICEM